eukprot:gnl/MRDRNA2_/MRDRNA2_36498_c0_seq1.p1 gnl/MRDRNA2_/MRDRNA2_36498_c0~~gnl/MRDRNA2_/MRDRNA2_36498_c0_seq1.p1  ORF type:complete len:204 (-),score=36.12 gnl/MRDRNA2_/MRDRNA2_36498_c0_seq1:175-786(-)
MATVVMRGIAVTILLTLATQAYADDEDPKSKASPTKSKSKEATPAKPKGATSTKSKEAKAKGLVKSKSARAGLVFPVGRITRELRKKIGMGQRVGAAAPVMLAGVLEYLCAEVLELSGNAAERSKKIRITPRHIQLAVNADEDLQRLFGKATIAGGGVTPNIQSALLKGPGKAPPSMNKVADKLVDKLVDKFFGRLTSSVIDH